MRRLLVAVVPAVLIGGCGSSGAELRIVSEDGAGGSSETVVVPPTQTHWTYGLGGLCVSEPAAAVARLTLVDPVGMSVDAVGTRSGPVDVFGSPDGLAEEGVTSNPRNDATISTVCVADPNDVSGFTGIYLQISKAPGRASFSAVTVDWESGNRSGTLTIPFQLVLCDTEPCER